MKVKPQMYYSNEDLVTKCAQIPYNCHECCWRRSDTHWNSIHTQANKKAFHRGKWRKLVSLCVCVRMTTAEHQVTKRWNACAVGGRKREGGVRENQRDGERWEKCSTDRSDGRWRWSQQVHERIFLSFWGEKKIWVCRERKEDSGVEERSRRTCTTPNSSVSSWLSVHHDLTDALIQSERTVRSLERLSERLGQFLIFWSGIYVLLQGEEWKNRWNVGYESEMDNVCVWGRDGRALDPHHELHKRSSNAPVWITHHNATAHLPCLCAHTHTHTQHTLSEGEDPLQNAR